MRSTVRSNLLGPSVTRAQMFRVFFLKMSTVFLQVLESLQEIKARPSQNEALIG